MTPYLYPGVLPPITQTWIIPGFDRKKAPKPFKIQTIYKSVVIYFGTDACHFASRKRELVLIRQWTSLLALCAGFSLYNIADFFQKDHSTVHYSSKKIIGEIERYSDSKKDFEYFYRLYNFCPDEIQSLYARNFIKSWKNKQLT